jgi:hypothetical protein
MDLQHGRSARAGGRSDRGEQHHVRGGTLPEQAVCSLCKPGAPLQWNYNPSPIACCKGRPVHTEVFVGDSGGEFGVRGWLAAFDTKDGKVLWQAYNAGPDKDMLIGALFNGPMIRYVSRLPATLVWRLLAAQQLSSRERTADHAKG